MRRNEKTERNKEIYALRKAGAYYWQLADRFEISIIRVRQIIEAATKYSKDYLKALEEDKKNERQNI